MKKILSFFAILFIATISFSQTAVQPAGSGTQADPYQIATLDNLYWLSQNSTSGKYYIQTANIDASSTSTWDGGAGFTPISYFSDCQYDGANYTINALFVNRPLIHQIALFGSVSGGSIIKNLNITNANLTGNYNVGIIAGSTDSSSDGTGPTTIIKKCSTSGTVTCEYNGGGIVGNNNYYSIVRDCNSSATVSGNDYLQGGLVGNNDHHSEIINCYSTGAVSGTYAVGGLAGTNNDFSKIDSCYSSATTDGTLYYIGGLAGRNQTSGVINNSYSTGDVSGPEDVGGFIGYGYDAFVNKCYSTSSVTGTTSVTGGFVGKNRNTVITNSYATGAVNGDATVGGFVGYNYSGSAISNCYSIGAVTGNSDTWGFAGINNETINNSFWDQGTSGQIIGGGAIPKSTVKMKNICTYVDGNDATWDFIGETDNGTDDIWGMNASENGGYPFLSFQPFTSNEICTNECVNFTLSQDDIGQDSGTFGVSLADFNGDGYKDVVIIDAYEDIEVYFWDTVNNKMGTTATTLGGDYSRFGVEVIDIENDGDWDFITSPMSSSSGNGMEIWENDGAGNFTLKDNFLTNKSGHEFAVGDLNGDGYTDIFFPHIGVSNSDISIMLNDGSGNFTSNGQSGFNVSSPEDVSLNDFDNDGDLDAVVVRSGGAGFVGKVFINDGTGQFTNSGQEITYGNAEGVATADIDADGDIDIVVAPSSGNVKLWTNDGLGIFMPGDTLFDAYGLNNDVALKDLNFDGYPDIITDKNIWLNNPNNPGKFIIQNYSMSVSTHDFEVVDMNNDGLLDIYMGIFSNSNGDNIYIQDMPIISEIDQTICFGDSLQIAGIWRTVAGQYFENNGCGALNRITLSFYNEINTTITETAGTLEVAETGATYQWLDCDNSNNPITGATSQTYTPTQSGNYAVEVTNGTCFYISACFNFTYVDINNISKNNIKIYPNPTSGIFTINLLSSNAGGQSNVIITDITGKTIKQFKINKSKTINLKNQPTGIYFIKIQTNERFFINKIIKD